MTKILLSLINLLQRMVNKHRKDYKKELVKELVDDGIRYFKVINKDGKELDMVILKDDYDWYSKNCGCNGKSGLNNLGKFVELLN